MTLSRVTVPFMAGNVLPTLPTGGADEQAAAVRDTATSSSATLRPIGAQPPGTLRSPPRTTGPPSHRVPSIVAPGKMPWESPVRTPFDTTTPHLLGFGAMGEGATHRQGRPRRKSGALVVGAMALSILAGACS